MIVVERPSERGAEVVVVDVEQLRSFDDNAGPLRILVARQLQEVPAVRGLQRFDLVRGDESLPSELPNGLQKAVAGARTVVVDQQQGLVDQAAEAVQHIRAGNPLVGADLLS